MRLRVLWIAGLAAATLFIAAGGSPTPEATAAPCDTPPCRRVETPGKRPGPPDATPRSMLGRLRALACEAGCEATGAPRRRPIAPLPTAASFDHPLARAVRDSDRHREPGEPQAAEASPAAGYAYTRTAFGSAHPALPDAAYGVVAPPGNFVYVSRKVLLPITPVDLYGFMLVEVYTKAGVWQDTLVLMLPHFFDWVGGLDAYREPSGDTALYVVGSWSLRPFVIRFRHERASNKLRFLSAAGAGILGDFGIFWNVKVSSADGTPKVYVAGSDYMLAQENTDGLLVKYELNLVPTAAIRLWTPAQGYPCNDEVEGNSMAVTAQGVFLVADVDKVSDHYIGDCFGKPQRGGIARVSLDLTSATFKKFDDGAGSPVRTSDALATTGTGLFYITGRSLPGRMHLTLVVWTGAGFGPFYHNDFDHPGVYAGASGMPLGGTLVRQVSPTQTDLLVSAMVGDNTTNCEGDTCADWELWVADGMGTVPPTVTHLAFEQPQVSPTFDVPWALAADADDPDVYYEVGCAYGTRSNAGWGTDCFTMRHDSPNFESKLFKLRITQR